MRYIVLDLEFNQAFDYGDGKGCISDERCPFEIIQIGAVKLNEKFEYEASLSLLIKPFIYRRVHPYVQKITGLNNAMLDNQQNFHEAYNKLLEFIGNERVIYCIWGNNDIKELYKNIAYYNLHEELYTLNFIDVQSMASKYLNSIAGMCIGLKNAVIALNFEISRPFHNALYDAEYTAKILQHLRHEPIIVNQFTKDNVVKTAKPYRAIDFGKLYKFIEKELGRHITNKEKYIYRSVYFFGKEKRFDKN